TKHLKEIQDKVSIQNESFVHVLVGNGHIDETKLALFIANHLNLPYVNLSRKKTDLSVVSVLPESMIRKHHVFPLFKVQNSLILGMIDPLDPIAIDAIEQFTHLRVEPVVVTLSDLNLTLNKHLGGESAVAKIIESMDKKNLDQFTILGEGGVFRYHEDQGPISRLAYLIISTAIRDRASDIHMEPKQDSLDIRFRLDGVLHKTWSLPQNLSHSLTSSIKILAKMDIVERRLPLDGSFRIQIEQKLIDIRVSSYPLLNGEKIVMRLLDQESMILDLESLGMNFEMYSSIKALVQRNYGIFFVTGPTGSGKTTTLYSILNQIKSIEKNIVTIEDPVEYHVNLLNQSEINPKAGLTFSSGLRSVLRQDPDVILIGEIRDKETAKIAFQAALTGHLVFSTLHTNDTASAIARLIDMGVEPYLISSVLIGVLSQRLIRRTCPDCRDPCVPSQEHLVWSGLDGSQDFLKGRGCKLCRNTGYRGRTGIFELLTMSDSLKELINQRQYSETEIRSHLQKDSFVGLKQ
ncbi:MAG: GspE/PulE family protein, partial [Candidatus Margulisiibacteriota bacterium]